MRVLGDREAAPGGTASAVIAVDNDVDVQSMPVLRARIEQALAAPGGPTLTLDFSRTDFLDSTGLGLLVWTRDACRSRGIDLILDRVATRVRHLMQIAELEELFAFTGEVEPGPDVEPEVFVVPAEPLAALLPVRSVLPAVADRKFDTMAALTRRVLDVPVALVSLIDRTQQVIPGAAGLGGDYAETRSAPLSHSFCKRVVAAGEPLIVTDARRDPRVSSTPAVADGTVVAYAGMPIVDLDGNAVGSLCAMDSRPRQWSMTELDTLSDLAAACSAELQLRVAIGRAAVAGERERMAEHLQENVFSELLRLTMVASSARSVSAGPAARLMDQTVAGLEQLTTTLRSTLFGRGAR